MNPIAYFRTRLGLQQEGLAWLLGCSLAQVKMAETGKRSLPAVAQRQLQIVQQWLEAAGPVDVQISWKPDEAEELLAELTHKWEKWKRLQKKWEEKYAGAVRFLALAASPPPDFQSIQNPKALEAMVFSAQQLARVASTEQLPKIAFELAALEARIRLLKK